MKRYEDKVRELLAGANKYHDAFYRSETFHGPSLFFHQRALNSRHSPSEPAHLEYVYATLTAWGMHRMGPGGSKMHNFENFFQSVQGLKDQIAAAQKFTPQTMGKDQWLLLKEIFKRIKVMASSTSLVGNSKVMHHMLPNIVPPIDREYTLRYLRGSTNIKNDLDQEWEIMEGIILDFFIPISCDEQFSSCAKEWMLRAEFPWDTSLMKVIDNLVIGARK